MTREISVNSVKVLEARPLAELVAKANEFSSKILFRIDSRTVNAKSIMGVMGLGIDMDSKLIIEAEGDDEAAAIDAIAKFLNAN